MTKAPKAAARELTRQAIIDCATGLIRKSGVDGLSMRQLAGELGVTATALYYHIGSRDRLLDLVICELLRALAEEDTTLEWSAALENLLVRLQYLASEYPGIQQYLAHHLESQGTLMWMELILQVLVRGGFEGAAAARAMNLIGFYNSPVPLRERLTPGASPWEATPSFERALAENTAEFPHVAAVLPHLGPPNEAIFRIGLRSLIAGMRDGTNGSSPGA